MSIQEENLTAIANAIREKEGSEGPIPASEFAARILALPSSSVPDNVRTITVTSSDPEMGTVSGGGVASDGVMMTVLAKGTDGYDLKSWIEDGEEISDRREYTFEVGKDRKLEAIFDVARLGAWNTIQFPEHSGKWTCAAYGGGRFVALSSGIGIYSDDGINWKSVTITDRAYRYNIAYGNGLFIATGNNNNYVYSEDGLDWKVGTFPEGTNPSCITYGNGRFVACDYKTSNLMVYSFDGINWDIITLPVNYFWQDITYGNGKFIAVGNNQYVFLYSEDGLAWEPISIPINNQWLSVTYGNGLFVATGLVGNIVYSEDGRNWTNRYISVSGTEIHVAYGDKKFVGVDSSGNTICSYDAITWVNGRLPSNVGRCYIVFGGNVFLVFPNDNDSDGSKVFYAYSRDKT